MKKNIMFGLVVFTLSLLLSSCSTVRHQQAAKPCAQQHGKPHSQQDSKPRVQQAAKPHSQQAAKPHFQRDGKPHDFHHFKAHNIADAKPKIEPRSKYGNPPAYTVFGKRYTVLQSASGYSETGIASWYGTKFHRARTSSGEPYNMYAMTAAHKTLPLPSYVRVTNLITGKAIVVKINDRGPFITNRIIDLSFVAAKKLGIAKLGVARVKVDIIEDVKQIAKDCYRHTHKIRNKN